MNFWHLLVLILPVNGTGLVTGWVQEYSTEAECRQASIDIMSKTSQSRMSILAAQCVKSTAKEDK